MIKTFSILGEIVETTADKWSWEDVCPDDIKYFLDNSINPDDEIVLEINSVGGSVSGGLTIYNLIKSCGHKTTARIMGLAASISSVVACGCDTIEMYPNSLFMVHLPWTSFAGNSDDCEKLKDTLEKYNEIIVKSYKSKFNVSEEKILEYMRNETWITASGAKELGLNVNVIEDESKEFKLAACSKVPKFMNIPKDLKLRIVKDKEFMPKPQKENIETVVEDKKDTTVEQVVEDKKDTTVEQVIDKPEQKDNLISVEDCEKRVSGMQAKMQIQINDLKKDYESKVKDLTNQLQSKDQELSVVNDKLISLTKDLDTTKNELQNTVSALKEKELALEPLNSNVNKPAEDLPTLEEGLAKCKTPSEKVAFIKSGKYQKN